MAESIKERWVLPDQEQLLRRSPRTFLDHLSLTFGDLAGLPREQITLADDIGFTPQLLALLRSTERQAF